jgi:uncharacterized protein YbjQ (UPF0145 family)
MLRRNVLPISCLCAMSLLSACATQAPTAPVNPDQVSIHESVKSAPVRYQAIKRLWVDSWRSAFFVPTYRSREEAAADFRVQAASLGGNGVINFGCYNMVASPTPPAGSPLACNGTVVRFE